MARSEERLWAALVTFERGTDDLAILPDNAHGACGWMGCLADGEAQLRKRVAKALAEVGLQLVEIGPIQPLESAQDASEFDEHLAANLGAFEPHKKTAWGTIHVYLADGEA